MVLFYENFTKKTLFLTLYLSVQFINIEHIMLLSKEKKIYPPLVSWVPLILVVVVTIITPTAIEGAESWRGAFEGWSSGPAIKSVFFFFGMCWWSKWFTVMQAMKLKGL